MLTSGVGAAQSGVKRNGTRARLVSRWQDRIRNIVVLLAVLLVAACTNALELQLPDSSAIDLSAKGKTAIKSRQGNQPAKGTRQGSYELFAGTAVDGGSVGDLSSGAEGVEQTGDKFSINVDGADIGEVTKLVLGDTLGMNYILDQRVQGTMTIATVRPMTAKQVLSAFEQALRLSGATLIRQGETYKVVPLQEVLEGEMGSAEKAERGASATPGYGVTIIPLRFISPNNMLELLDSFIARSGSVRASNIGNMVLLRGSGQERQQLVDVVLSFDVDWMKQQTASIAILANSKPAEMTQKLQSIFATDFELLGRQCAAGHSAGTAQWCRPYRQQPEEGEARPHLGCPARPGKRRGNPILRLQRAERQCRQPRQDSQCDIPGEERRGDRGLAGRSKSGHGDGVVGHILQQ